MNPMSITMRWTLARKIGGLATFLISLSLIILVYSIISLKKIQAEMREIASLDIPLMEITNEMEIYQLEQHIIIESLFDHSSQKWAGTIRDKKSIRQKLLNLQNQLNDDIEMGITISEGGFTSSSRDSLKRINDSFLYFQKESYFLHSQLLKILDDIESKSDLNDRKIEQILKQKKMLEDLGKIAIASTEELTDRRLTLTQKHEKNFFIVNTILGFVVMILGGFLAAIIIINLKTNLLLIFQKISEVIQFLKTDGDTFTADDFRIKSSDELGDLAHQIRELINSISLNIEQRKKLEENLKKLASIDTLTGALNRRKWDENLEHEIERSRHTKQPLSIIILDADHFKRINDTHSHQVGDRVLCEIVAIVKQQIRIVDSLYRIGGEEFTILCPETNRDQVLILAERIRRAVEGHRFDVVHRVTVSLGATELKGSDGIKQLFQRADVALYQAKRNGRNQVQSEI